MGVKENNKMIFCPLEDKLTESSMPCMSKYSEHVSKVALSRLHKAFLEQINKPHNECRVYRDKSNNKNEIVYIWGTLHGASFDEIASVAELRKFLLVLLTESCFENYLKFIKIKNHKLNVFGKVYDKSCDKFGCFIYIHKESLNEFLTGQWEDIQSTDSIKENEENEENEKNIKSSKDNEIIMKKEGVDKMAFFETIKQQLDSALKDIGFTMLQDFNEDLKMSAIEATREKVLDLAISKLPIKWKEYVKNEKFMAALEIALAGILRVTAIKLNISKDNSIWLTAKAFNQSGIERMARIVKNKLDFFF